MEAKQLKAVEVSPDGEVEAVFSTFDVVDLDDDIVLPGAIRHGQRVAISTWNHGSWNPGQPPIGIGTIHTTPTEAILRGRFLLNTAGGRDTFEAVAAMAKAGLGEWSYSLNDVVSTQRTYDGKRVRVISSVHVLEVSPVMRGASVNTRTLSAKDRELLEDVRRKVDTLAAAEREQLHTIRAGLPPDSTALGEFMRYQRALSKAIASGRR